MSKMSCIKGASQSEKHQQCNKRIRKGGKKKEPTLNKSIINTERGIYYEQIYARSDSIKGQEKCFNAGGKGSVGGLEGLSEGCIS